MNASTNITNLEVTRLTKTSLLFMQFDAVSKFTKTNLTNVENS